ncbi:hypothetical protein ACFX1Z_000397 [Malus domestica]
MSSSEAKNKENKENPKGYLENCSSAGIPRLLGHHTFSSRNTLSNDIIRRFTLGCPNLGTNFSDYFTNGSPKSKGKQVFRRNREGLEVFPIKLKVRWPTKEIIYITQLVEIDLTLNKRSLEPSLFTLQLLVLLEQTNTDTLQLIDFFLLTFVDLQYTLEFQHLGSSLSTIFLKWIT